MPVIRWGHETEIVEIEWLWKPFIPYGKITIIEGDGGDGKTTMILTIAAMLSAGIQPPSLIRGHLVDEPPCNPITTFYLTNEDEVADSSLKRFIRAGGVAERFAYSGELEHHMTLVEEELLSAIEQTHARLLIIDPFQAFLPEGTNMGSITKMRAIFTTLGNVAKQTDTAIVLVGHLNKSEGSKDIHRGFGSADIAASVRSILMVEMDKKDREKRWVRSIKSNFDESDYTPIRLVLDEERRLSFAEFEDEEEAEYDEHVWLSLKNTSLFIEKIAEALGQTDSQHAADFTANAASYIEQLGALDAQYQEAVDNASVKTLLFGDRFPFRYMVDDYGLDYYAAFVGCSAETEASFETIMFLANKVDELGLKNIMQIESADGSIANTIKDNTKTKDQEILTLDSMQAVTADRVSAGETYLSIMESDLTVLKQALN